MSQATILVIDDSATIRRLVDSHMSHAGYRVVLATNAEEGVILAGEIQPDVILLDHQLPGTTGYQVCRQLIEMPALRQVPVIITSTLRKRAYAEYTEIPNVVDSLPKPFTPELLTTTISNAMETGALVVQSQAQGTAVPEVIQSIADTALSGSFSSFSLREVLDFLNNGSKHGAVEVETARDRIWFFIERGRIQGVTAAAVDFQEIASSLPESLRDLAPVLNFTVGGRNCSQVDGLVQLLDRKVLDPRMLRGLLRHQAATLTRRCFVEPLRTFRFEASQPAPVLFTRLPLDVSLAALLVDGSLTCPLEQLPPTSDDTVYLRRALRGQSLDRAGLAAQHMKILGYLEQPRSSEDLAQQTGLSHEDVRRVLHGLVLAEWVQVQSRSHARSVIAFETDATGAQQLRDLLSRDSQRYVGKVVHDRLAMQLLLKRSAPDVLLLPLDGDENRSLVKELRGPKHAIRSKVVGIVPAVEGHSAATDVEQEAKHMNIDAVLRRPYSADETIETLDRLFNGVPDTMALSAS